MSLARTVSSDAPHARQAGESRSKSPQLGQMKGIMGVAFLSWGAARGAVLRLYPRPPTVKRVISATGQLLQEWGLRQDGPQHRGAHTLVTPVRTADGQAAVLRIGLDDLGRHEHLVLRRWGGDGAVRLLRADPHRRALLVERAHPRGLDSAPGHDAAEVIAGLYRRLHVPALPQLPSLASLVQEWVAEFAGLPRGAPIPHRLVEQAAALGRDLLGEADSERVLHGDLHPGTVLAADRAPWLATAPRPVNGDPHFEVAPVLWHRWDRLAGGVRDGVRARFHAVVDAAGFDEDRARAWVIVRVVHEATRAIARGAHTDELTRLVAIAKAVQD
jgi:streptomycin 6-kinase